jgi:hypothetical protein
MKRFRNSHYFISEAGLVYDSKRMIYLKPSINPIGYAVVKLVWDKNNIAFMVHRLVAETYLTDFNFNRQVNHLDRDKQNNAVSNLEMTTSKQNNSHYLRSIGKQPYHILIEKSGMVREFETWQQASDFLGLKYRSYLKRALDLGEKNGYKITRKYI